MLWNRFRLWLNDNALKGVLYMLFFFCLALAVSGLWAFFSMESYTKGYILASSAIGLFIGVIQAPVFVYFYIYGFRQVFGGVGASRVRDLFKKARLQARAYGGCMIFIDEIDAVGRTRKLSFFGSQETDTTLNQLLVEIDGLSENQGNVVVIGATNASEDV